MESSQKDNFRAVNTSIKKIEELLNTHDPLHMIASISKMTLLKNPETYTESNAIYTEAMVEYLLSLILSKPYPTSPTIPNNEVTNSVFRHWKKLLDNTIAYFGSEMVESQDETQDTKLRFSLILSYILRRGDAYIKHLDKTFLDLFAIHNKYLKNTLGFSAEDLHSFFQKVKADLHSKINQEIEILKSMVDAYKKFRKLSDKKIPDQVGIELADEFRKKHPDRRPLELLYAFEIKPSTKINNKILEQLSCKFGENQNFLLGHTKWRGWLTNDTIIPLQPFVEFDGKYYLFHLPLAMRNCTLILENLLKQKSPKYYQRYLLSRDNYVETTTIQLIEKLLPGCDIYSNLFYTLTDDSQATEYELDGLVTYDDCLILIEAKASKLPRQKRRGSIEGLKDSLRKSLAKADEQAKRALQYINSAPRVSFFDKKKKIQISIEQEQFKHIFIVLTSIEPMYELSTHLSSAKKLGLVSGTEWPWFVYLNDLRVISEIIDHPTTFLHYLKRRISLNDYPSVRASDELDYFMSYIKSGLFFSKDELEGFDIVMILSHTAELDAYYSHLQGERSPAPKPNIKMHPLFDALVSRLETEQPSHFSSACLHLLEADNETRSKIVEVVQDCESRYNTDAKSKSAALRINGTGLLLGCMKKISSHVQSIRAWGDKWLNTMDVDYVTIICWSPPIETGEIRIFLFTKD